MKKMKKYQDPNCNEYITVYQVSDLPNIVPILDEAQKMWREICKRNYEKYGDEGTCVGGAGIAIPFLGKRQRLHRSRIVISANSVAQSQGSLNWERGIETVLDYLKQAGIDAEYNEGWMD